MTDTITAKILRFDPSVDSEPHYETYTIDWVEDESGIMSALQVLIAVEEQEAIGYDYCCHSTLCGRCSMKVDGEACLACTKVLDPGEHTFEPLDGFTVIKDLVVDRSRFYDRIVSIDATIKTKTPITEFKDIDYDFWWGTLEKMTACRECMCCYSVCPAVRINWKEFVGPAAMGALAQRFYDTIDESDRLQQAVFAGLFNCIQCGSCSTVCSANIPLTETFGKMQKEAESRGLKDESDLKRF